MKRTAKTQQCQQLYEEWGVPVTCVEELHDSQILRGQKKKVMWKKLIYYRDSHKYDLLCHEKLYKLNRITPEKTDKLICPYGWW